MIRYIACFILLTFPIAEGVFSTFHCDRKGQSCSNSKACDTNAGTCTCGTDTFGVGCEIATADHNTGDCVSGTTCKNSGNCKGTGASTHQCFCAIEYDGPTCELKRYDVSCGTAGMTIRVDPYGTFTGTIVLRAQDGTTNCPFAATPTTATANVPTAWLNSGGQYVYIPYSDPNCGITPTTAAGKTTYQTEVLVKYGGSFVSIYDELLSAKCVIDANNNIITQDLTAVSLDKTKLKQAEVETAYNPIAVTVTKGGAAVTSTTPLEVGDVVKFDFTVTAPFTKVRIDTVEVKDDGSNTENIMTSSCQLSGTGSMVDSGVAQVGNDVTKLTISLKMIKFPTSTTVIYKFVCSACTSTNEATDCAYPANCNSGVGNPYGRRKRSVTARNDTVNVVQQTFYVIDPTKPQAQKDIKTECTMGTGITVALAVMGVVIFALFVVLIIFVARTVGSRRQATGSKQDLYGAEGPYNIPRMVTVKQ